MIKNLKPGDDLWVIDRCDDEMESSCVMFLAAVPGHPGYAIGTAWIDGMSEIGETMDYHVEETRENYGTDLMVYPACDCYESMQEADAAILAERESDE